jgi:hypothetical protein
VRRALGATVSLSTPSTRTANVVDAPTSCMHCTLSRNHCTGRRCSPPPPPPRCTAACRCTRSTTRPRV